MYDVGYMHTPTNKLGLILDDIAYIFSPAYNHPRRNKLLWDYLRLRIHASLNRWIAHPTEHFLSYTVEVPDYETFFAIFRQVFVRHAYYFVSDTPNPHIMDCGGNIGMTTLYYKYLYPDASVTVFEPSREVVGILQRNFDRNTLTNVTLVQAALSSHKGTARMYTRGAAACGNTLDSNLVETNSTKHVAESYEVSTVVLSDYIHRERAVDIVKLDIEGAEGAVIQELAHSGALAHIKKIVMEYHYYPHSKENDLVDILSLFKKRGWETQFFFEDPKNNFSLALELHGAYPLSIATVSKEELRRTAA